MIEYLRRVAPGHQYATSMAPPAAQQIVSALRLIRGEDGSDRGARKIAALHENSNWFRRRLVEIGCNVLGDWNSPVMARAQRPRCMVSVLPVLHVSAVHDAPSRIARIPLACLRHDVKGPLCVRQRVPQAAEGFFWCLAP